MVILTEHGQDVQTFIVDQQGQIIIITVVERVQQVSSSGVNVSWLFIADHSELERGRVRVQNSRSGTR